MNCKVFFKKYCGKLYNKMGLNVPFLKLIFLAIRLRQKTRNLVPYMSMIVGRRYFNFNYKYHISSCGIVWNCDENKGEQTVWSLPHTSSMCKACVLNRWRSQYSVTVLWDFLWVDNWWASWYTYSHRILHLYEWFSKFIMHQYYLWGFIQIQIVGHLRPENFICNELSGVVEVAGVEATFWKPLAYIIDF